MTLKRRTPQPVEKKRSSSGITALIDGDVIVYACGFASQKNIHKVTIKGEEAPRATFEYKKDLKEWVEKNGLSDSDYTVSTTVQADPVEHALHSVKVFLNEILEVTDAEHYKIYLTGKGNFREEIATILPYKGNRNAPKPLHYDNIKQYLVDHWEAIVVEGMEADDAMAIEQELWLENIDPMWRHPEINHDGYTVICSIDKDLRMVPGWHYNWNKDDKPVWVSEEEGIRWFYTQLLTGDKVDNIQGIPGIGPKKAEKILEECVSEEDMYDAVWWAYHDYLWGGETITMDEIDKKFAYAEVDQMVLENAQLLWMIRELDEDGKPVHWEPPV